MGKLTFDETTGEIFINPVPVSGEKHEIYYEFAAEGTVADFAGSYYLTTNSEPDLSGTKVIRWKMFLEENAAGDLFSLGVPLDNIRVRVTGGSLWVGIYDSATYDSSRHAVINSMTGRTFECMVVKNSTTMDWVQIGGFAFGNTNSAQSGTDYTTSRIGADGLPTTPTSILNNAYVWDIRVDGEVAWAGNGSSANENSAWVDTVGSNDATWVGSPSIFDLPTDPTPDFDDWYMPSTAELDAMRTNLYDSAIGGFDAGAYWTSTETSSTQAVAMLFSNGTTIPVNKSTSPGYRVRPARTFTAGVGAYSVGDSGPAGGWIFYVDGTTTYYEAAPDDNVATARWSNITNASSTATGAAIGDGITNTPLISGQGGHIYSCAALCEAYEVYL